jgi:anti-sigma regulatory factor (Ser/Thr protein kinase)
VSLRLTFAPSRVEMRVLDEGSPVPLDKRAPREIVIDPDDPSTIPDGGRGIFLMYKLMDRVEFGREGETNVLLLTKALPDGAE